MIERLRRECVLADSPTQVSAPGNAFVISPAIEDALIYQEGDECYDELERLVLKPEVLERVVGRLRSAALAVAGQLGWIFERSVALDGGLILLMVFRGQGGLLDVDERLLELTGEHELSLRVLDLQSLLAQAYECGAYDEGSIVDPSEPSYAEGVRTVRRTLEL